MKNVSRFQEEIIRGNHRLADLLFTTSNSLVINWQEIEGDGLRQNDQRHPTRTATRKWKEKHVVMFTDLSTGARCWLHPRILMWYALLSQPVTNSCCCVLALKQCQSPFVIQNFYLFLLHSFRYYLKFNTYVKSPFLDRKISPRPLVQELCVTLSESSLLESWRKVKEDAFNQPTTPLPLLVLWCLWYRGQGWTFDDLSNDTPGISDEIIQILCADSSNM